MAVSSLIVLGSAKRLKGDYNGAVKAFSNALDMIESADERVSGLPETSINEDTKRVLLAQRGLAYTLYRDFDSAISDFRRVVEEEAVLGGAYMLLGSIAALRLDHTLSSIQFATEAIHAIPEPHNYLAYELAGYAFSKLSDEFYQSLADKESPFSDQESIAGILTGLTASVHFFTKST